MHFAGRKVLSAAKTMGDGNRHLTSGRLLARNTVWNLVGSGAPMAVAVFCIPVLIRGLGKERFGVLTLAWALIGYASFFDLGLGRALTQLVARKLGAGEEREIPELAWTSLVLMSLLGLATTVLVLFLSPLLASRGLKVPVELQHETMQAFRLLGLSVPFVITTAGLRGLLEAHQRFGMINALRVPMGVFTFVGPLAVLPFSKGLTPVVGVLVIGRVAAWAAHLLLCLRVAPELRQPAWEWSAVGPLMKFGSWMTISNVLSPLMYTVDRFAIGALVSVAAVAYYATSNELITKLLLIPGALMGVMFPAFSTSFAQDREHTALLFRRSVKSIFLVLFPITLCAVSFAQDGLRLWLGSDFALNSYRVLQILAAGVFINSLAHVPFALLQGVGRPEVTATLHLIELPPYLALLWWLTRTHGIQGAAIAWSARVIVEAFVAFILVKRCMPGTDPIRLRSALLLPGLALVILGLAAVLQGPIVRALFVSAIILCFVLITWFQILTPGERSLAQTFRQV